MVDMLNAARQEARSCATMLDKVLTVVKRPADIDQIGYVRDKLEHLDELLSSLASEQPVENTSDPSTKPVNAVYMNIHDFWTFGHVQEINRRYLHHFGLALAVKVSDVTGYALSLAGVVDNRDSAEGMGFTEEYLHSLEARTKAANVEEEYNRRVPARLKDLGVLVQKITPIRTEPATECCSKKV